jgi:flagellar motility protein MotE (MotC chaperone)
MTGMLTASVLLFAAPAIPQEKKAEPATPTVSLEEERLKVVRADIQSEIDQLKKLKQELETLQKAIEGKRQEQSVKVVKMIEAMPPEQAARTLEKLDEDTAVMILSGLKPRSAGNILAQLEPAKAASLSKKALPKGKASREKTAP